MTSKRLKFSRLAMVAHELGVPRSTLRSGCDRGEIRTAVTGCGLVLVDPDSARRWLAAADERRTGPKPRGQ